MLRDKVKEAMKTAMLAKDDKALGTIRMIMAKMKDKDIEVRSKGNMDGINDDEILSMMQTMVKQRRESITMYKKGNRQDLVDNETAEIKVIETFMPTQMETAEIKEAIQKIIETTGASSIKDMGKVMGGLKKDYAGKMDFSKASIMVKELLVG